MERRIIVAGNWKMNLDLAGAVDLASEIAQISLNDGVGVTLFPTFPWIVPVSEVLGDSPAELGAQDAYVEDSGAFTGEVSPLALAGFCRAILAGHSERRHVIGESDALIRQKVDAIVRTGMAAYLCVGETLNERESGRAEAVVHAQLSAGLDNVSNEQLGQIVIAYEPVWAIGTGVAASSDDAQEMCASVRDWLGSRYGDSGRAVQVLYGGSVSPDNVDELFNCEDIDGGLVGGASLSADSFGALIEAANRIAAV